MTDPMVSPQGGPPALNFPPQSSVDNINGIVNWLGLNKVYTRVQVSDQIDLWLKQSTVAFVDYTWVKSNFMHLAIDHPDMLLAYYGIKVTFSWAADGVTGQASFSRP